MALTRTPDDTVKILHFPADRIDDVWPLIVPFLTRIPEMGTRYPVDRVREWIRAGDMQAWAILDTETNDLLAAFVTEAHDYGECRVLRIPYIGGEQMERWIGRLPEFEDAMRREGFDQIEIQGRPGWERATGYRPRFVTFVKDLNEVSDG